MDCGIPFCHNGCPLGNLIPEWNDLVWRGDWEGAAERLHATNNFPEFTGRLCPAPCESRLRARHQPATPVTIKNVEVAIIDRAWDDGGVTPQPPGAAVPARPSPSSGRGRPDWPPRSSSPGPGTPSPCTSAPTGSAACCATASPSSRWRSATSTARIEQMRAEGTRFRPGVQRRRRPHRWRSCATATTRSCSPSAPPRRATCPSPAAIWPASTRRWSTCRWPTSVQEGDFVEPPIDAFGKHVMVIGGGDTGADCLGTATRQGAASVTQLEIMPRPTEDRPAGQPWPTYPMLYRVTSAHEEGGERVYAVTTDRVRRRRGRQGPGPAPGRGGVQGRSVRCRSRAPSARSRPNWCCWRWASLGPDRATGWSTSSALELDEPRQHRRDDDLRDQRARRVRRR